MTKKTLLKIATALIGLPMLVAVLIISEILPSPLEMLRPGPRQQDMTIDSALQSQVIDGLVTQLHSYYIFPEKVEIIESRLGEKQLAGDYAGISSAAKFARKLSDDIAEIGQDLHLQVSYSEDVIADTTEETLRQPTAKDKAEMIRLNFGIGRVERLGFNIGYVELNSFEPAALVASRFGAIMTLMADTRSLIIDLRYNHGGDPEAVALLSSYFFDRKVHLTDIYYRDSDHTEEFWTSDELAGPRYGEQRKVYLLLSDRTFSAGEDFAYQLKNLKRATLIGESTGGGAHPGDFRKLSAHFEAFIPNGRSINSVTQSNWEGIGVQPDILMDSDDALDHAQLLILKERLLTEENDFIRGRIEANIADFE